MFWSGSYEVKKGFVIVYTLIFGMVCLFIVLLCFNLYIYESNNIDFLQNIDLKENNMEKDREYLLTDLSDTIKTNISDITNDNVRNYFTAYKSNFKIIFNNSCVVYDYKDNEFVLVSKYDNVFVKQEYYGYTIMSGKIKFTYLRFSIVEGGIEDVWFK